MSGKKLGMSFNPPKVMHPTFGEADISGVIPFLLPTGEYKQTAILNDRPRLEEIVHRYTNEWRNATPNETDDIVSAKCRDFILLASCLLPALDVENPRLDCLSSFLCVGFAFDDILDQMEGVADEALTYANVRKTAQGFFDLWRGTYESMDDVLAPIPLVQILIPYVWKCLIMSKACIPDFCRRNKYKINELVNSLKSFVLLQEKEPGYEDEELSEDGKVYFGGSLSGMLAILEYVVMVNDIDVSEEIRSDILFQKLTIAFSSASHLMNDVFGLSRDIQMGQVRDSSILSMVKDRGVPLQDAFNRIKTILCNDLNDLKILIRKLRLCYPDEKGLLGYLRDTEIVIDGQIYWYMHAERYGEINLQVVEI